MSWRYCKLCNEEMEYPTPYQILREDYECQNCDTINDPLVSKDELILQLFDRVEKLELLK